MPQVIRHSAAACACSHSITIRGCHNSSEAQLGIVLAQCVLLVTVVVVTVAAVWMMGGINSGRVVLLPNTKALIRLSSGAQVTSNRASCHDVWQGTLLCEQCRGRRFYEGQEGAVGKCVDECARGRGGGGCRGGRSC